jgi:hypothetical protein
MSREISYQTSHIVLHGRYSILQHHRAPNILIRRLLFYFLDKKFESSVTSGPPIGMAGSF